MAMRLRGEGLNCAYDVGVAGTAADIAGELMADLALGRVRVLRKQLPDGHDHARRAKAALQGMVLMESRLNRMQSATAGRESFDRRDRRTVRHHGENRAGFDRLSIDIDGAGAALRGVAADMGPCETEIVSKQMNQKLARFQRSGVTHAVNVDRHDVILFVVIDHSFLRGGHCTRLEYLNSQNTISSQHHSSFPAPTIIPHHTPIYHAPLY